MYNIQNGITRVLFFHRILGGVRPGPDNKSVKLRFNQPATQSFSGCIFARGRPQHTRPALSIVLKENLSEAFSQNALFPHGERDRHRSPSPCSASIDISVMTFAESSTMLPSTWDADKEIFRVWHQDQRKACPHPLFMLSRFTSTRCTIAIPVLPTGPGMLSRPMLIGRKGNVAHGLGIG